MALLTRTTRCRGCGAEIAFIKTKAGKSMPVDPEPVEFVPELANDKFVLVDGTVERGLPVRRTCDVELHIGYRSHFSTCPEREKFTRNPRKKDRKETEKP